MADDTNKTELSEVEILNAQLQIAEAKIIEQKATIAGLQAEKAELVALIAENSIAQTVLANAAASISDDIDKKQMAFAEFPAGLEASEISALKKIRQTEIDDLIEKADRCKKYVRGDL